MLLLGFGLSVDTFAVALGGRIGTRVAKRMEFIGGAVLIAVAVKVLASSL